MCWCDPSLVWVWKARFAFGAERRSRRLTATHCGRLPAQPLAQGGAALSGCSPLLDDAPTWLPAASDLLRVCTSAPSLCCFSASILFIFILTGINWPS